jgi:hypothetical protein
MRQCWIRAVTRILSFSIYVNLHCLQCYSSNRVTSNLISGLPTTVSGYSTVWMPFMVAFVLSSDEIKLMHLDNLNDIKDNI